ncbi:putative outer membrane protein [Pseudonocardia cypriaca]|uniref:Putative outer membrane protein n=1 Tax=Pseudonocardia cypriaca TaxID=882449 RepID=A0A543FPS2_9PSEU|nr:putative outer membrane protein [Pseudonocardia cypriaca]
MLRRIPRILRAAVIVTVLLAVSASVYQSWATGAPGTSGWTQTQWGPLGPADRDLLIKVRLAGLWEGPTGQQAEQMATSAEVREVGRKLAEEHAQLDEEVRKVADQLGVPLPSGPNAQQMGWMSEITSKTGSEYDRTFVQIVREAHGMILPVISEVRSGTQNDLIRQFAETGNEFVTRHHQYLESTGLVDYSALPHHGPGLLGGGTDTSDLLVPFLVFIAALLAAIALVWGLRSRSTPSRRQRVTVPEPSISRPAARLPELTAVAAIPAPRSMSIDDTGPISVISDVPVATLTDSGAYRLSPDSGAHATFTKTRNATAVSDSGSHRAVSDSDSHRSVSTSGSHRMPRSRRARHSTRR